MNQRTFTSRCHRPGLNLRQASPFDAGASVAADFADLLGTDFADGDPFLAVVPATCASLLAFLCGFCGFLFAQFECQQGNPASGSCLRYWKFIPCVITGQKAGSNSTTVQSRSFVL